MKNVSITLESTAIEFNKWREKRKAGEAIPDKLWEMVSTIYDHYPHTILCQKLNLKLSQLKSKGFSPNGKAFEQCSTESDSAPSFVHVAPAVAESTVEPVVTMDMPSVEIHRPDGVTIIFKHHDNAQLTTVLQQLIGA